MFHRAAPQVELAPDLWLDQPVGPIVSALPFSLDRPSALISCPKQRIFRRFHEGGLPARSVGNLLDCIVAALLASSSRLVGAQRGCCQQKAICLAQNNWLHASEVMKPGHLIELGIVRADLGRSLGFFEDGRIDAKRVIAKTGKHLIPHVLLVLGRVQAVAIRLARQDEAAPDLQEIMGQPGVDRGQGAENEIAARA